MNDIIERLRACAGAVDSDLARDAADEIDRLRTKLADIVAVCDSRSNVETHSLELQLVRGIAASEEMPSG